MNSKITDEHLRRRAIVYVRQSTAIQLIQNRESQLRQYGLAEYARKLGFSDVETIDADLGRSGSGLEERPGFQRLMAEVCSGRVGAVFCIEASRVARNGRDWLQLFELQSASAGLRMDGTRIVVFSRRCAPADVRSGGAGYDGDGSTGRPSTGD